MSLKLTRILAGLVLIAGFTTAAVAQSPAAQQGDQVDQLAKMLSLSDEQQQEIRSIFGEFRPQIQSLQQELQQAQSELQSVAGADADESTIREKASEIGDMSGEMTALSAIMNSRVQSVFTDEQRQQLQQIQAQRQKRMQQRMQQMQKQRMQQQQGGQNP